MPPTGAMPGQPLSTGTAGLEGSILEQIMAGLQGGTRFTPEVMAILAGQAHAQSRGAAKRGTEAIQSDALRRGLGRSPAGTQRGIADVQRGAEGQYAQTVAQQQLAKINGDYQDKTAALDRAQKYLDSQRDYILRADMTAAAREASAAQISLGYARIQAERGNLQMQLDAQWRALQAQIAAQFGLTNLQAELQLPNLLAGAQP
jgi:hypothetical protein